MTSTNGMSSRDRTLAALARKPVDRIPYVELLVDSDVAFGAAGIVEALISRIRIGGRLGIKGILHDVRAAYKAQDNIQTGGFPPLTPSVINVMSAAEPVISRILSRDNIAFWGSFPCFTNHMPYLLDPDQAHLGASAEGLIKRREDLDKMVFRDIDEVIKQARQFLKYKGDFAACAIVMLGIDPAWHSMGFENFSISLIEDPDFVGEVMRRITDWYARLAEELCNLGFDFIWAADDIAYHTAPMFSPKSYREVLLPHTRKVAEKISIPWIYHSDGNLRLLLEDLLSQGMNALHPLEPGSMDLKELKGQYGDRLAFVGNINVDTLARGTGTEVAELVRECIDILGRDYGYLMSSSNSIMPGCNPKNVQAMVDALDMYGHYL